LKIRDPIRRFVAPLVAVSMLALTAGQAHAQRLTVQGDQFAIDGTPRFLVFLSFFGAMGAPNIAQDLRFLRTMGFDGIRIWPNLDTGPQLMNADGSLKPAELAILRNILDQARMEHLVVDVSFTYEHIRGMSPATARVGIVNATEALRSYDNVLFDIQNERNVQDRRFMSEGDVGSIFRAIKAVHPERIATADNSLGEDWGPQYASDFTARLGLDVTAFHERRGSDWYTLPFLQGVLRTLKQNGKPAYLQETNSTRDPTYRSNDRVDYFLQGLANAKLFGAAGWCFHTLETADFREGPAFLEDRFRQFPEPEWAFVNALKQRVVLRTGNGVNYIVPESGGGAGVRADRTASGPGSWEVLTVVSLTGGPLVSGDRVAFLTADGTHYLQAVNGGGAGLRAGATAIGPQETFVIERASGAPGVIRHGEPVLLRANDSSWYVTADGGGGGAVNANTTNRGAFETFMLLFASAHSSDVAPGSKPFTLPPRRPEP
jgi:hypothetical protein